VNGYGTRSGSAVIASAKLTTVRTLTWTGAGASRRTPGWPDDTALGYGEANEGGRDETHEEDLQGWHTPDAARSGSPGAVAGVTRRRRCRTSRTPPGARQAWPPTARSPSGTIKSVKPLFTWSTAPRAASEVHGLFP